MNRLFALSGLLVLALPGLAQNDRLESIITGNQEQPQVLYIVPWQTPESPTLKYDVVQSQSAKVYQHLERSELKRELAWIKPVSAGPADDQQKPQESSDGSHPQSGK